MRGRRRGGRARSWDGTSTAEGQVRTAQTQALQTREESSRAREGEGGEAKDTRRGDGSTSDAATPSPPSSYHPFNVSCCFSSTDVQIRTPSPCPPRPRPLGSVGAAWGRLRRRGKVCGRRATSRTRPLRGSLDGLSGWMGVLQRRRRHAGATREATSSGAARPNSARTS